jgi:hypothetical protein
MSVHHATAHCAGASRVPSDSTGASGSQGASATRMKTAAPQTTPAEKAIRMAVLRRLTPWESERWQ